MSEARSRILTGWPLASWLTWGALGAYWVTLFLLTHLPVEQLPMPNISDKVLHLGAYGGLGGLLVVAYWVRPGISRGRQLAWLLLLLAAFGAVDELLQIPVGRNGDVLDWLADVIGAALAVAILGLIWRHREARRK